MLLLYNVNGKKVSSCRAVPGDTLNFCSILLELDWSLCSPIAHQLCFGEFASCCLVHMIKGCSGCVTYLIAISFTLLIYCSGCFGVSVSLFICSFNLIFWDYLLAY